MNTVYSIRPLKMKKSTLVLHPDTASALGIEKKKVVIINFGGLRQFADVYLNRELPKTEIQLSSGTMEELHLPQYPDYEILVHQNDLIIGPYIGMLMGREDKKLSPAYLKRMKIYLKDYERLHGAVVVFALDKVDTVKQKIEGYCYNPASMTFQKGVFPFPAAIYRTVGLSKSMKKAFLSLIGDRFFNSRYFNKWKMYEWYSRHPELSARVPYTVQFFKTQDVFDMLNKFGKAYIKPVSGLGGRGIVQVSQNKGKYVFKYREASANHTEVMENKNKAAVFLKKLLSHGRYLIQQPIELIQIKGRVVDFRCVMQKDPSGNWGCKAIIGRYGDKGSVVSNISSGGSAFKVDDFKEKGAPLSDTKLLHLSEEIGAFALQVCNTLDEYGIHCGILGLDIGVDREGKLWLIEINNRDPDPTIALDVNDRSLYVELKTGILAYAKALAGF